jgi:hypothetical protein
LCQCVGADHPRTSGLRRVANNWHIDGKTNYDAHWEGHGFREEPGRESLFVADLNGPLYIIDKATRKPTVYLTSTDAKEDGASSTSCSLTLDSAAA